MNLTVLSHVSPQRNFVGYSLIHNLINVIQELPGANVLYPRDNRYEAERFQPLDFQQTVLKSIVNTRNRLFRTWFSLDEVPHLAHEKNILLVPVFYPHALHCIYSLGAKLKEFDLKIAYVLDGIPLDQMDSPIFREFDHVFVISSKQAELIQGMQASVPVSCLPLGIDLWNKNPYYGERPIDVISYGRRNEKLHNQLQRTFNSPDDHRIYHHSTFATGEVVDLKQHFTLHNKLLQRSKISLCFEPSNVPRFSGCSPLLYRWLEGWASGCAIVGRRPLEINEESQMTWESSTIELPANELDWLPFIEQLIDNPKFLNQCSKRNYIECLLRHDWRYRVRNLFETLQLAVPETLNSQICHLEAKAESLNSQSKVFDFVSTF